MVQSRESTQQELIRRRRIAVMAVYVTLGLTVLLMAIGYLHKFPLVRSSYRVAQALWVAIAVSGLGSIALRRTRLSSNRLQDMATLRGMSGLLAVLQNTSLLFAILSAAIGIMGFITTMMTNDWIHVRNAGVIAIAVVLYSYPTRTSWQRVVQRIERKAITDTPSVKGNVN